MRGVSADAKAEDITVCDDGFAFCLQEAAFCYNRYGLQRI